MKNIKTFENFSNKEEVDSKSDIESVDNVKDETVEDVYGTQIKELSNGLR